MDKNAREAMQAAKRRKVQELTDAVQESESAEPVPVSEPEPEPVAEARVLNSTNSVASVCCDDDDFEDSDYEEEEVDRAMREEGLFDSFLLYDDDRTV